MESSSCHLDQENPMLLLREVLRRLDPALHASVERSDFIHSEQMALAHATTLARIEADAIANGSRYPTFWDRYAELRRAYGLPPAPRPSA